jgi:hypothetical protein
MSLLRKMFLACIAALFAGALALSATGCAPAEVRVSAAVTTPRLVWIGPGIWVVEDYPWSVYYHDGFYWMYRDGLWYRSDYYSDGYVRIGIRVVPVSVVRIHRPHRYVRYRAPRHARVRVIEKRRDRSHRAPERRSRDHRR